MWQAKRHMLKYTSWRSSAAVASLAACGQVMTAVSSVKSAIDLERVASRAARQGSFRSIPIICIKRSALRDVAIPSRSR